MFYTCVTMCNSSLLLKKIYISMKVVDILSSKLLASVLTWIQHNIYLAWDISYLAKAYPHKATKHKPPYQRS